MIYYNNTEYGKINTNTTINVCFFDENRNIIAILNNDYINVTLNNTSIGYLVNDGLKSSITFKPTKAEKYSVNIVSDKASDLTVKTAILIINGLDNTDVDINCVLNSSTSGGNITIVLNETATGDVSIIVNDVSYNATLNKGKAVIPIPTLAGGNISITFKYSGDSKFNPIERNYLITIPKISDYKINVTGKVNFDLVTGVVNVILPEDANGNIKIILNNSRVCPKTPFST